MTKENATAQSGFGSSSFLC